MNAERFSRSGALYGAGAREKLASAKVAVFGVGAVGSFAAEALARLGVGEFVLVDFDKVEPSNINRQLCALGSTIGMRKTEVMRSRILDINPDAKVSAINELVSSDNAAEFASLGANVIADAIDSIAPKAALCAAALSAGAPIVSSMGAARRKDPSKVETAELFKTRGCPLAARLRKELRARGFSKGQPCVFSAEEISPETHVASGSEGGGKIVGSTPVVTGVFGLFLAHLALKQILEEK
ncbi:MAG: tRNA threonylcarbamoyladenosine dehydratase [Opitutales bacterium]|nr:tRNA threonylcarbamoyladenosine dehydratase [Opitutales bacterium]